MNATSSRAPVGSIKLLFLVLVTVLAVGSISAAELGNKKLSATDIFSLEQRASAGELEAMYQLGYAYLTANGVARDVGRGLAWIRTSADGGYAEAQGLMGYAYARGQGVDKDNETAVLWLTRASDQGNAKAQALLGQAYMAGLGIARDRSRAIALWKQSALGGNPVGKMELGLVYYLGVDVSQDTDRAVELWREAAKGGNSRAKEYLARFRQRETAEARLRADREARAKERRLQQSLDGVSKVFTAFSEGVHGASGGGGFGFGNQECISDVNCEYPRACVRAREWIGIKGVCVEPVDEAGIPTYSSALQTAEPTEVEGCTGNMDCPLGAQCTKPKNGLFGLCTR